MRACLVLLVAAIGGASAWQEWVAAPYGPGPRAGHSLHNYNGRLYLFGGRGKDSRILHQPKTYEIVENNGVLRFGSYDDNIVRECDTAADPDCYLINVGIHHNDIWSYNLDCDRYGDMGCHVTDEGWTVFERGAPLGGCVIWEEEELCTHPTERFDHGSAMFSDGTLIVFGGWSRRCGDYCDDMWSFNIPQCMAHNESCKWYYVANFVREGPSKRWRFAQADDGETMWLYGGHRLWHGFGQTNSLENRWNDTTQLEFGGYLDDLWSFTRATGQWQQIWPQETCFNNPGILWEQRFDTICHIFWPGARAEAAMVHYQNALYLHGGYNTFRPYPHIKGRGSGPGTGRTGSDGLAAYPTLPFYLDDLWVHDLSTGLWREITPTTTSNPAARRSHTLVVVGDVFFLIGGYGKNYFNNEFWIYNVTTNAWLRKEEFIYPKYGVNCTDDTLTGAQSVYGQPTRFTTLDGQYGRGSEHVFIRQQRRQAPGWDGCRDRLDERADLPSKLQWRQPSQRANHAVTYSDRHHLMILYGGLGFVDEQIEQVAVTHPNTVVGDMWQYHIDRCPKNCSGQGSCFYGFCFCHDGFYGVDCSNVSCPGDFCYYDNQTHAQICKHCCSAPDPFTDGDLYKDNERKVPCDHDHPGTENGVCDGFGNCQCAPPYITMDCSVRDCPNNCSLNGWCSVEYPVARCICDTGWVGLDCSEKLCLNNCTHPNGNCSNGVCTCGGYQNPYNRTLYWHDFEGIDCSYVVPFAGSPFIEPSVGLVALLAAAVGALALGMGNEGFFDEHRRPREVPRAPSPA